MVIYKVCYMSARFTLLHYAALPTLGITACNITSVLNIRKSGSNNWGEITRLPVKSDFSKVVTEYRMPTRNGASRKWEIINSIAFCNSYNNIQIILYLPYTS